MYAYLTTPGLPGYPHYPHVHPHPHEPPRLQQLVFVPHETLDAGSSWIDKLIMVVGKCMAEIAKIEIDGARAQSALVLLVLSSGQCPRPSSPSLDPTRP